MDNNNSSILLLVAIIGLAFCIGSQDINAHRLPIIVPGVTSANVYKDSFESSAAEGMVAMDIVVNVDDENAVVEECKCNGTKRVRTPDGLSTIPCPCGKDCDCKRPNREEPPIEPQVTIPPEVKIDVIPPIEPPQPIEPEQPKEDEVQEAPKPKFEQKKEYQP